MVVYPMIGIIRASGPPFKQILGVLALLLAFALCRSRFGGPGRVDKNKTISPRKLRAILHGSFFRRGYEIESQRGAQSVSDRGRGADDESGSVRAFRSVE